MIATLLKRLAWLALWTATALLVVGIVAPSEEMAWAALGTYLLMFLLLAMGGYRHHGGSFRRTGK